jgi:hypothetical protein
MESVTPIDNPSVFQEARGNLSFLLSVIRCGEQLSEGEESNVRRVIARLDVAESALRQYVQRGHHDTCSHALSMEYQCDCGFVAGQSVLRKDDK